jgi:hypothetical protein
VDLRCACSWPKLWTATSGWARLLLVTSRALPFTVAPIDVIATAAYLTPQQILRLVLAVLLSILPPDTSRRPSHHFSTPPAPLATVIHDHNRLFPSHISTRHHGIKEEGSSQGTTASRKSDCISTNRMQVIILGDSGVGKTSLMNQYVPLSPRAGAAQHLRPRIE